MVVHSAPAINDVLNLQRSQTWVGRWKMIAVWLICAAPVVASYLSFYVIRPESHHSFGELIEPQRPLPNLSGITLNGDEVNLKSLTGQWLLVSVGDGNCTGPCQAHLYLQRQLRESLGKDKDRLDWVWLVTDPSPVSPAILPGLRDATVLRVPVEELKRWLYPASAQALSDHLYLVDPLGHWMLRFPADLDQTKAAAAKRDLDRVLRASASWDKPGRPVSAATH